MAYYTRQITFKVSQAAAAQLDKLGVKRDLSRNLVAKELVIAALNGDISHQLNVADNMSIGTSANGIPPVFDSVPPNLARTRFTGAAGDIGIAELLAELRELRSGDVAALRNDLRRLSMAIFCQAGLDVEQARERTNILFESISE